MDPKVSVIVPIRNERRHIAECLGALLNQRNPPSDLEILVVDGMSDDGTRDVVAGIANEHPEIRVLDNPRQIVPAALNIGIASARGEVIVRVDGHTCVAPDFLRANLDLLREHPEAWSVGGPIAHRARTKLGRGIARAMSSRFGVGGAAHRREDYEGYAEGTAFPAFRRDVFEKIGLFDEDLVRNQDDELNFRITSGGGKIFISPRVKHEYYVRESLSGLARQYSQYAYWKVVVFRKHRRVIAMRHLAPVVFVVGAVPCAFMAIVLPPPLSWLAMAPLGTYGALLGAAFVSAWREERDVTVAASAAAATLTMHVSYGIGTLLGIVSRPGQSGRLASAMERLTR